MKKQIKSNFELTGWDDTVYDNAESGPQLSRVTVNKIFHGDLEGKSMGELLLCQTDPNDLNAGAGYIGSERFVGKLNGRSGAFVMQHGALGGAGVKQRTFGHVVPGSATGELAGLRGDVELNRTPEDGHYIILDFEFGDNG